VKELIVVTGPVHAEKSTKACQIARRFTRLAFNVMLVRPRCSIRAHERPGRLVTKNGLEFPSVDVDMVDEIEPAAEAQEASVVWVDEPALFPDEPYLFTVIQRLRQRLPMIVSGLSATSEIQPFGQSMPRLLAVADRVIVLRADCDFCGHFDSATRSMCLVPKDGQVLVGGAETYKAACQDCWEMQTANPSPR